MRKNSTIAAKIVKRNSGCFWIYGNQLSRGLLLSCERRSKIADQPDLRRSGPGNQDRLENEKNGDLRRPPFFKFYDRLLLSAAAAEEEAEDEADGGGDEDGLAGFLPGKFLGVFDQLFEVFAL